VMC